MKRQPPEATVALDQALEWIERLRDNPNESEAFFAWLIDSPRHVEVFLQALTLEQRIAAIFPSCWHALDKAAAANGIPQDQLTNVIPLGPPIDVPPHKPRKRAWWPAALAAGIIAATVLGWCFFEFFADWRHFTTAVGEQRTIQLPDGSIIELNTDSNLKVRISASARELWLLQGEALFKVQHDASRPFTVRTGDSVIEAVGTQFDVYQRRNATTVSVLEGRVRVNADRTARNGVATANNPSTGIAASGSTALSAGEQVDIEHNGQIEKPKQLNAAHIAAWRERRLIFDEETLQNIASEFNRYNHRHLHIEGDAAAERRFSGIFDADDPESLAKLLSRDTHLTVERLEGEIVVRPR